MDWEGARVKCCSARGKWTGLALREVEKMRYREVIKRKRRDDTMIGYSDDKDSVIDVDGDS